MEFTCDQCARCCLQHRVPLTRKDIGHLTQAGHRAQQFVELLPPSDLDLTGEPETLALLPGGPRLAVLRHRTNESGCVFLGESRGGRRPCLVHAHRPAACRTYPFDRSDTGRRAFDLHPSTDCPPETGVLVVLEANRHAEIQESLAKRDRELHEHADFIQRWNRRQRTLRALGRARKTATQFVLALATGDSQV